MVLYLQVNEARKCSSGSCPLLFLQHYAGMWQASLIANCFVQFLNIKASCKNGSIALVLNFPTLSLGLCCIFSRLTTVMGIRKCKKKKRKSFIPLEGSPFHPYSVTHIFCLISGSVLQPALLYLNASWKNFGLD